MANILQPLNTQSPIATFGQTASALGAYESFRKMREERKRRTVIQDLLGPAATGDTQSLQVLRAVDPNSYYKLTGQMRQHETGEMKVEAAKGAMSRADKIRQLRGLQNAFANIQNVDPVNQQSYYDMIRARAETEGALEPGTLQDEYSPEVAEDIRLQLQIGHDLISDPVAFKNLTDSAKDAANAYGINTPEFRQAMELRGGLENEKLMMRKGKTPSALPPGVSLMRGIDESDLPETVRKEIRERVVSSVDVLKELQDLRQHIAKVGFESFMSKDAALAKTKVTSIKNKIRLAERMGTLDAGAEKMLSQIVGTDPTGVMQGRIKARFDELIRTYRSQMASNLRAYNVEVDLGELTGGYLAGTSKQMLQEREMGVPYAAMPTPPDRQMTLREAAPFITREADRLRKSGFPKDEVRRAAAMRYGFGIGEDGKFFVINPDPQQSRGPRGNKLRMQTPPESMPGTPPVGSGSPRAESRDMPPMPTEVNPLDVLNQKQLAARDELQRLTAVGSPEQRYKAQANPLPPPPGKKGAKSEQQEIYFSNMYAQGHSRKAVRDHYFSVWGHGRGKDRRKPNLKVKPLPRLLYENEKKEQEQWQNKLSFLRAQSGLDKLEYLKEQREKFVESGGAERAAQLERQREEERQRYIESKMEKPMTRQELRQAMIKRRQEAARRRYERKLERFESSADRATRQLEGAMPPPSDQQRQQADSVPRARR